jgi:arabinose-5-phosphate isomerase
MVLISKYLLSKDLSSTKDTFYNQREAGMKYREIIKEVLLTEAKELETKANTLQDNIDKAIEIISNRTGKLIITGVGKSGLVGSKMAATFASTGTSSFFIHPTEAMHGDLGMISKGDVVLAISYSGESSELTQILPHLKRFSVPLIGMAKTDSSTLGKYSDAFISIEVEKEACPLGVVPTSSTTLTMALGDALAVALMKKSNFQKEDFASFHPGGTLGKQLFVKLSDLMRKENLPIVSCETSLKDAIVTMTSGKLGTVLIVDENNSLIGMLSDGDLRRALLSNEFDINQKAVKYMTKNPKTVENANILAAEALQIIENHKIQSLIITNSNKEVEGIIHIHDLVENGIK